MAQSMLPADSVWDGPVTREDLSQHYLWFSEGYRKYEPDNRITDQLKPSLENVTIMLVLGTWCGDSKEHVPAFFKVMDAAGMPEDKITMLAIRRKKERKETKQLKKLKIEYVPTFIIYRNGKEIGRIVEDTKQSMEKDLLKILKPPGGK